MSSALDTIMERAALIVADGGRDAEDVILEAYDEEVYEWLDWELLQAVYRPDDLITESIRDGLINYLICELKSEVKYLIDERVEREEAVEEAENAYYDLGLDELEEPYVGNRERDVLEHLADVEHYDDNGHDLYRFYHEDGKHSCTWDETQRRFIS